MAQSVRKIRDKGTSSGSAKEQSCVGPQSDFSVTSRLLSAPNQLRSRGAKRKSAWQFYSPSEIKSHRLSFSSPWQIVATPLCMVSSKSVGVSSAVQPLSYPCGAVPTSIDQTTSTPGTEFPPAVSETPTSDVQSANRCPGDGVEEEEDSEDDSDGTDGESSHFGGNNTEEPKRSKRTRTAYSNYQLDQLELVFTQTQYPDVFLREEISGRLGIKEDRIQVWFQNRRARSRKQERTGCVSFRSRYHQRRLQKVIQDSHGGTTSVLPGHGPTLPLMLSSHQSVPPFVPSYAIPTTDATLATSSSSDSSSPTPDILSLASHPGFHTLHPRFPPRFGASYFPAFYTTTCCGQKS